MKYIQASSWFHYGGSRDSSSPKGYMVRFARRFGGMELEQFKDIKLSIGGEKPTWFLTFQFRPLPLVESSGDHGSLRSHLDKTNGLRIYVPAKALKGLRAELPTGHWRGTMRLPSSGVGWDVFLQGSG